MWFDSFIDNFKDYSIVYVTTPPEICFDRVVSRARKGEEIPIEYLKKCDLYHKKWIFQEPGVILQIPYDFGDDIVKSVIKFIN